MALDPRTGEWTAWGWAGCVRNPRRRTDPSAPVVVGGRGDRSARRPKTVPEVHAAEPPDGPVPAVPARPTRPVAPMVPGRVPGVAAWKVRCGGRRSGRGAAVRRVRPLVGRSAGRPTAVARRETANWAVGVPGVRRVPATRSSEQGPAGARQGATAHGLRRRVGGMPARHSPATSAAAPTGRVVPGVGSEAAGRPRADRPGAARTRHGHGWSVMDRRPRNQRLRHRGRRWARPDRPGHGRGRRKSQIQITCAVCKTATIP